MGKMLAKDIGEERAGEYALPLLPLLTALTLPRAFAKNLHQQLCFLPQHWPAW
jgi:hypothetical protein